MLPSPIVEEFDGIHVVRDDLLEGGTKRRLFTEYIKHFPNDQEFVYASPRQGYGQLALSLSCRDLGKQAVVFVPKGKRHQLTIDSEKYGAEIHEVPMGFLSNLNHKSKKYCEENNSHLLPFGGDHPIIIESMTNLCKQIKVVPSEIWSVISSGVINRGLQNGFPNVKCYGVMIGHQTTEEEQGRATLFKSKYKFEQNCKKSELPPFPSSLTYDSKAWTFIQENAKRNSLFWNVGS